MTSEESMPDSPALIDKVVDVAISVGVVVLILVGFVTSYRTLRDLAATVGGYPPWLAPAVPLSFDLGIVVLSLKVVRAARKGRAALTLRLLVALLSGSSVIANATSSGGPAARLLHAVPPAMFIVCFESVVLSMRRTALVAQGEDGRQRLPRYRAWLWLLAPRSTWFLWRHEVVSAARHPHHPEAQRRRLDAHEDQSGVIAPRGLAGDPTGLDRDAIVRVLLNDQPELTAAQLADRLAVVGHRVSLRTAQRLKRGMAS